jgi:hypothetical protein
MTAKQRVVPGALTDAQRAQYGQALSARQVAALCAQPWHARPDLVTQALWLLHAQGLVLVAAGCSRAWKITGRRRTDARAAPR